MREKIRQLAKENFQYELPEILLSQDTIELSVKCGSVYKESLFITNSEKISMKGLIYCTCPYVKMGQDSFLGKENQIFYEVCVRDRKAGERIKGEIILETSCGEKRIPVFLKVLESYVETFLGKIRDLFQFANLAKVSPREAVHLFASPEFEEVFLKRADSQLMLYKSLIKSTSKSHAMEEFLISINKKKKLVIEALKEEVFYEKPEEAFLDKLVLAKDTWGYEELTVKSNVPFLIPVADKVWTDQFAGNLYELEYIVDPRYMNRGTNYGRLEIITANETLSVEVTVKEEGEKIRKRSQIQKLGTLELFQNYLNFRLGQIDSEKYVTEGKAVLGKYRDYMEPFWYELLMAQFLFAGGEKEECGRILNDLLEREEQLKNGYELEYCGYWYLKALLEDTEDTAGQAVMIAEVCYQQTKKWQMLWMLLYLDKKYEVKELRIRAVKEHLEGGASSPVLYYELCSLYNQEPTSLKELTRENIAALHWGTRMHGISEDLALQYALLAGKLSSFSQVVYHDMEKLYEVYETDEILMGICMMLVRNEKAGRRYFPWYQLGVEKQLRITNLYEYYMYSIDEEKAEELPPGILHYFLYDSNLNDRKRAFLYSYIVTNQEQYPEIFESYEKQIRHFAIGQMEKGNNDANLSVLYEELFRDGFVLEKLLDNLAVVMFQYQISCRDSRMRGVCVLHKEVEKEEYVPLEKGKAIVNLYTEGARLVFVDGKGVRYSTLEEYSLKKLNHLERYMEKCYHMGSANPMLLLALCEKIGHYHKKKDDSEKIQKQALLLENITQTYRKSLYKQLVEYYYDTMQNEELEALLVDENLIVEEEDRGRIVELSMIRCLEEQALKGLLQVDWESLPINRIQKFLTLFLLQHGLERKDGLILSLSYYVLERGNCNKTLLKYLVLHYQGPVSGLFAIWKRCTDLEPEGDRESDKTEALAGSLERIEEELLCKMLFTENISIDYYPVFASYYSRGCHGEEHEKREKRQLIKAYLAYHAYRYVVHGTELHEGIWKQLEEAVTEEEFEIGTLALLKHDSGKKALTEPEKQFCDFWMYQFMEKNMVFPFFADFRGKMVVPQRISGKYYVEYCANPDKKVYISYAFAGKEPLKFETEPMRQIYPGVFVKELVLFYNEELEYYIYEEEKGQQAITESDSVVQEDIPEDAGENRQSLLNLMLLAVEVKDDKTLLETMEDYIRKQYVVDSLFKCL